MKLIRVIFHREDEGWWADSPDVQGWSAAAETLDELKALADPGVRFAVDGADVLVLHLLDAAPRLTFDFIADRVVSPTKVLATDSLALRLSTQWQPQLV